MTAPMFRKIRKAGLDGLPIILFPKKNALGHFRIIVTFVHQRNQGYSTYIPPQSSPELWVSLGPFPSHKTFHQKIKGRTADLLRFSTWRCGQEKLVLWMADGWPW
jgi:hypothetical protein